jgi:DNA-binding GntR family transcriptional regulator
LKAPFDRPSRNDYSHDIAYGGVILSAKQRPSPGRTRKSNERLVALWREVPPDTVAADAIYSTLREAIVRGILPPGERLGEIQLASFFSRSRTPVREAILRLEAERLAERSNRRGFVVGSISREEILEVYSVREVLDGLAARLASQSIRPAEMQNLRWLKAQAAQAAAQQDYRRMLEVHIQFHEDVARASGNSLLVQMMQQIHDRVRRFPTTTFSHPGRAIEALDEHEALLNALERRDPDDAERLARAHMSRAMQVRVAMIQHGTDASPSASGGSWRSPRR